MRDLSFDASRSAMFASLVEQVRTYFRPKSLGQRGEALAVRFLKRKGYIIVARSARDKTGELDIVAVDRRVVVFVEVKTRASHDAGHPAEAVNLEKQRRLTNLALRYLKRHDLLEQRWRFDVMAITWPDTHRKPRIEHYIAAFEPVSEGQMFS
jgi:putative endonuclease